MKQSVKKSALIIVYSLLITTMTLAQTPVVYKEVEIDPLKCLQINSFEVIQSTDKLKEIPMKYNAKCESIDYGKIDYNKKSLIACSQFVRNGEKAITTTKVEVLRNDRDKRIDVYFASFGTTQIQRPGKIFENRKWLLLPKFPDNYKVDVHYSLKVVQP